MLSSSTVTGAARASVLGGADLRYAVQEGIGTRLLTQTVRPPLHLAKAYHENDWAISLLTSPTAGLLQGDKIEVNATVAENARAALISPAACRVHTMENGTASVVQKFTLEAGAVLDVWPAPLVLQKNAALEQYTEIDCAANASLFFTEIVAPGRAAYGESFEFRKWRSSLRLRRSGQLLAYENFSCEPEKGQPADWRQQFPDGLYASIYCLSPVPLNGSIDTLHALETTDAALGVSPLRAGGLAIKILAQDGIRLRETILKVRAELMTASGIKFPHALQRAQTFFF
jgi:urease accessory protein